MGRSRLEFRGSLRASELRWVASIASNPPATFLSLVGLQGPSAEAKEEV